MGLDVADAARIHAGVVLRHGDHRRHDHRRGRLQPRLAALDVEELLRAEIGAESCFRDDDVAQRERRARLEALLAGTGFRISPVETGTSWLEFARKREQSRERGVEGFMLKRLDAAYGTGRTKAEGLWWTWTIE
ncbi:MAG: hypothetical protein KY442_02530, partial [Proteobacteria bacterium]|nr:hypothetical protein [Pseudomonadota bacterium]